MIKYRMAERVASDYGRGERRWLLNFLDDQELGPVQTF